jgi:hypothetical protein
MTATAQTSLFAECPERAFTEQELMDVADKTAVHLSKIGQEVRTLVSAGKASPELLEARQKFAVQTKFYFKHYQSRLSRAHCSLANKTELASARLLCENATDNDFCLSGCWPTRDDLGWKHDLAALQNGQTFECLQQLLAQREEMIEALTALMEPAENGAVTA